MEDNLRDAEEIADASEVDTGEEGSSIESKTIVLSCPNCKKFLNSLITIEETMTAYEISLRCESCGFIFRYALPKIQNKTTPNPERNYIS